MTSCTWPWRACDAAMARSAASWPARSSPMPTRIPVVNGMASSPAASSVASRRAGVLVGRAAVRRQVLGQRLEHHPLAGRDRAQPGQLVGEERAGVGVGEQAGLLQRRGGTRAARYSTVDGVARAPSSHWRATG